MTKAELDFSQIPDDELAACFHWELRREASKQAQPELNWLLSSPLEPGELELPFAKLKSKQRADLGDCLKLDRNFDRLCQLTMERSHLLDAAAVSAAEPAPEHWMRVAINPKATLKQITAAISELRGRSRDGKQKTARKLLRDLTVFRLRHLKSAEIIDKYHTIYGKKDRADMQPARVSAIKGEVQVLIERSIAEEEAAASNPY